MAVQTVAQRAPAMKLKRKKKIPINKKNNKAKAPYLTLKIEYDGRKLAPMPSAWASPGIPGRMYLRQNRVLMLRKVFFFSAFPSVCMEGQTKHPGMRARCPARSFQYIPTNTAEREKQIKTPRAWEERIGKGTAKARGNTHISSYARTCIFACFSHAIDPREWRGGQRCVAASGCVASGKALWRLLAF